MHDLLNYIVTKIGYRSLGNIIIILWDSVIVDMAQYIYLDRSHCLL